MTTALIDKIRRNIIGEMTVINTCFGDKPLVYADYTASGRSLDFIEDYIRQQVLPYYANTHSDTSFTGAYTTGLREQSRQIIREAVNGNEQDKVIFTGPGATAAIAKLIDILNLRLPAELDARYHLQARIPAAERPLVFIGPYEHHSNELPWRESIAELVSIPLDQRGMIDLQILEAQLQRNQHRQLVIGSFSAASNVTGIKSEVAAITAMLHRYGALSFWDYAAAAPYVAIDMNPEDSAQAIDAVFISCHKFVGGPGTPGLLIVKDALLSNRVPAVPGGGTVSYVTAQHHYYLENSERREEGGTPAIVESIRAGLVFKLQQEVGTAIIEEREQALVAQALKRWQNGGNIEILGNSEAPRLAIISLRIRHQQQHLHYGFVVALLNDLFGIQARGGCSCAGPYGHTLLAMDSDYSDDLAQQINLGHSVLRPGWVRLNLNYFIDQDTLEYLLSAIEIIAELGWKLLPYYDFDQVSGSWRYQGQPMELGGDLNSFTFGDSSGDNSSGSGACSSTGNSSTGGSSTGSSSSDNSTGYGSTGSTGSGSAYNSTYSPTYSPAATASPKAPLPLSRYTAMALDKLQHSSGMGQRFSMALPPAAESLRWFTLAPHDDPQAISK